MNENINNEVMEVEAKEVTVVEEQTEVKGLIPKTKEFFKKNGKKIAKGLVIGATILGAGIVLGKRSNSQSEVIDIPDDDITECDNSDVEATEF